MGRNLTLPSKRLTVAAEFAATVLFEGENGKNMHACDVGCDHAKLSIYLVQSGICKRVLACDINDGPVEKAKKAVGTRKYMDKSLSEYIEVIKNDGLKNLDNMHFDRVFILGMGGELISDIISGAPESIKRSKNTGFVLQAMTSEYELRKYLSKNGYEIVNEKLVEDKSRVYSVMLCRYDGKIRKFKEYEYHLGKANVQNREPLFEAYLARKTRIFGKLFSQLVKANKDAEYEKNLLSDFEKIKNGKI